MASRRRAQNSGWISTGILARPSWPIRPDSPVVWSKWPWLQTIASMPAGSWPRRRRLPAHPSGVIPVSNSSRRTRPPLRTSTSAENPCWASGTSAALPPSIVGASSSGAKRAIDASGSRLAGPWSGSRMSVTLSQTVSTDSSSTGSSGSTSPFHSRSAGSASAGMTSARSPVSHMAAPHRPHRRIIVAGLPSPSARLLRKLALSQRGWDRAKGPPAAKSRSPGGHPAAHAPSRHGDLAAFRSPVTRACTRAGGAVTGGRRRGCRRRRGPGW